MRFNLVSNLDNSARLEDLHSYNHVIAWQLRDALRTEGHLVDLVKDSTLNFCECDHTIVISNIAMNRIRKDIQYQKLLRASTAGKMLLWIDSDIGDWSMLDKILCVNRCHKTDPERFRYVGWATDKLKFYPRQTVSAVFLDPYMWGWYDGLFDNVYQTIKDVVVGSGLACFQPVEEYNKGRVSWLAMSNELSQCSYFIATQRCNWGLTNLEAATAGALIVMHDGLDIPETWPSKLNYVTWKTREDLAHILKSPVDIRANREKALENTWQKVIERIMAAIEW